MKISLIVAMASNRAIGLNNQMPWHLSADLKKFKQITMGSPILMGRKTHESIGKVLPGRTNIIISRNSSYKQDNCLVFDNFDKAIEIACKENEEIFVMGGASIYEAMLAKADMLYLTKINKKFKGDTFFPVIDENDWKEISREDISTDQTVNFSYSFLKLEKLNKT